MTIKKQLYNHYFVKYKKVNEDYFQKWTNKMAYILGFICADGNIIKTVRNGGIIEISVQSRDKKILHFISNEISQGQIPIRYRIINKRKYYRIAICRRKIIDDLIRIGIVERKTFNLEKVNIPNKYISHFVRGFFDGDGYVRIIKPYDKRWNGYQYDNLEVTLTSTKIFLTQVKKEFLKFYKNANVKIKNCLPYYNAYCLILGSLSARYFGAWIYQNVENNFYLERKLKTFKNFYKCNKSRKLTEIKENNNANFLALCGLR